MESANDVLVALNKALFDRAIIGFDASDAHVALNTVVFKGEGVLNDAITGALRAAYEVEKYQLKFKKNSYGGDALAQKSYRVHFLAKSVQLVNDILKHWTDNKGYDGIYLTSVVTNFEKVMNAPLTLKQYKRGNQSTEPLNERYELENIYKHNMVEEIKNTAVTNLVAALKKQIKAVSDAHQKWQQEKQNEEKRIKEKAKS